MERSPRAPFDGQLHLAHPPPETGPRIRLHQRPQKSQALLSCEACQVRGSGPVSDAMNRPRERANEKKAGAGSPLPYLADHQGCQERRAVLMILAHEHLERVRHLMDRTGRPHVKLRGQIAICDRLTAPGKLR